MIDLFNKLDQLHQVETELTIKPLLIQKQDTNHSLQYRIKHKSFNN